MRSTVAVARHTSRSEDHERGAPPELGAGLTGTKGIVITKCDPFRSS